MLQYFGNAGVGISLQMLLQGIFILISTAYLGHQGPRFQLERCGAACFSGTMSLCSLDVQLMAAGVVNWYLGGRVISTCMYYFEEFGITGEPSSGILAMLHVRRV